MQVCIFWHCVTLWYISVSVSLNILGDREMYRFQSNHKLTCLLDEIMTETSRTRIVCGGVGVLACSEQRNTFLASSDSLSDLPSSVPELHDWVASSGGLWGCHGSQRVACVCGVVATNSLQCTWKDSQNRFMNPWGRSWKWVGNLFPVQRVHFLSRTNNWCCHQWGIRLYSYSH